MAYQALLGKGEGVIPRYDRMLLMAPSLPPTALRRGAARPGTPPIYNNTDACRGMQVMVYGLLPKVPARGSPIIVGYISRVSSIKHASQVKHYHPSCAANHKASHLYCALYSQIANIMAPTAVETTPETAPFITKSVDHPAAGTKPLNSSGALEGQEYFDVTPVIGREFPKANLVDWLDAPNSDELLRDLAITSKCRHRLPWQLVTPANGTSLGARCCLLPCPG